MSASPRTRALIGTTMGMVIGTGVGMMAGGVLTSQAKSGYYPEHDPAMEEALKTGATVGALLGAIGGAILIAGPPPEKTPGSLQGALHLSPEMFP